MLKSEIQAGRTYQGHKDREYYVQDICGQIVTISPVGSVDRVTTSLGRFAATAVREIPNK